MPYIHRIAAGYFIPQAFLPRRKTVPKFRSSDMFFDYLLGQQRRCHDPVAKIISMAFSTSVGRVSLHHQTLIDIKSQSLEQNNQSLHALRQDPCQSHPPITSANQTPHLKGSTMAQLDFLPTMLLLTWGSTTSHAGAARSMSLLAFLVA